MNSGIVDLYTLEFTYVLPPTAASTKRRGQQVSEAAKKEKEKNALAAAGDAAADSTKDSSATSTTAGGNAKKDSKSAKRSGSPSTADSVPPEPSTQPTSMVGSSPENSDGEDDDSDVESSSGAEVELTGDAATDEAVAAAKKLAAAKRAAEEEKKQQMLRDGKGLQEMALHEKLKAEKAQRAEKRLQEIQSMEAKIEKQKEKVRRCQAKLEAAEKQACATTFSDNYFLCQLSFKGEVDATISGEVFPASSAPAATFTGALDGKLGSSALNPPEQQQQKGGTSSSSSVQPSILAELLAATANEVGRRPIGKVLPSSRYYWDPCDNLSTSYIDLNIHVDKMAGSLLGSDEDLTNVILTLSGVKSTGGWCVGSVEARSGDSDFKITRANRVRFLLKRASRPRCTACGFPIPASVSYGCASNVCEYRSLECQRRHQAIASPYIMLLKDFSTYRFGRSNVMSYNGTDFQVFWRAINSHAYTVLVDAQNPLGIPYIMNLSLLKDAVTGVDVEFLGQDCDAPGSVIVAQNTRVFNVLLADALEDGHLALACIALNYLYLWCSNPFILQQSYLQYMACSIGQVAGRETIMVYTLAEFVMLHRPLFELSNILVEAALKSSMSLTFWEEIELAKQHLSLLCNSISFGPNAQLIRQTLGAESQRRALRALAKVYIIIATRLPKNEAHRTLQRAQDCYKDAIEEDKVRNDYVNMSVTCLQLAVLYRMFSDRESAEKAQAMQDYAFQLLRSVNQAEQAATAAIKRVEAENAGKDPNEAAAQQQDATSATTTNGHHQPDIATSLQINKEAVLTQTLHSIALMLQDSDGVSFSVPKDVDDRLASLYDVWAADGVGRMRGGERGPVAA